MVIDSGMMPPLLHAPERVAAVIEQAGGRLRLDAGEIFEHAVLAFRRQQVGEIARGQRIAVIAEQRFGAAVGRMDVAFGIEHQDAFGRGVEDRGKLFGVGVAGGRWRVIRCSARQ